MFILTTTKISSGNENSHTQRVQEKFAENWIERDAERDNSNLSHCSESKFNFRANVWNGVAHCGATISIHKHNHKIQRKVGESEWYFNFPLTRSEKLWRSSKLMQSH